jgi:membrane protease YdiL (CAAX protease family)
MNKRLIGIGLYIGISFALSWLIVLVFLSSGGRWGTPASMIVATLYMFMPMVAAILVQKVYYREPLKRPLGISFKFNRWWLVAWLLPPVIAIATIGVSLFFAGVQYSPDMTGFFERYAGVLSPQQLEQMQAQMETFPIHVFWIALLQGLIAGITINAVAGFGEELGWRGFLLKELGHMNLWKSSLLIGLVWGIWHTPIILQGHNYPQHPVVGVFMMIVFCILLSSIFSYVRIKSRSVIPAAIAHGSLNATAGLSIMMVRGGNDLTVGVTGLAGFITLLIVNIVIYLCDRSVKRKSINEVTNQDT